MTPKSFQKATISAVIAAFNEDSGSRRFLVADEPGLGKTVVARGVMSRLAERTPTRPLIVLYVCSNQAIASQNVEQLLGSTTQVIRSSADRPGLMPLEARSDELLQVYSLTPRTAFSSATHPGRGRVEERAFACALIERKAGLALTWLRDSLRQKTPRFDQELADSKRRILRRVSDPEFARFEAEFERLIRKSLSTRAPTSTWDRLYEYEVEQSSKGRLLAVTTLCRNCLAAAALSSLKPDIVIFDEFQRFQELLEDADPDSATSPAESRIREILTAAKHGRLLLLSATPYEALRSALAVTKPVIARRGKPKRAPKSHDFYHLLRFLWRNVAGAVPGNIDRVKHLFKVRDAEMSKGQPDSPDAAKALAELTGLLRQVMCRTERPAVQAPVRPKPDSLALGTGDIQGLRDFSSWIKRLPNGKGERLDHIQWIVPLWSSVPLTAQALGKRYVCWSQAGDTRFPAELRASHLQKWKVPEWTNVKLRWLLAALPQRAITMPWIKPTAPWWPLRSGWSKAPQPGQIDGKALVFSRFSATPSAIAGAVSFDLEAQVVKSSARARPSYKAGARTSFKSGGVSPAMFRLFFICEPLLCIDPLVGDGPPTVEGARTRVAEQLRESLDKLGIKVKANLLRYPLSTESWLLRLALLANGSVGFRVSDFAVNAWTEAVLQEGGNTTAAAIHRMLKGLLNRGETPAEMDFQREFKPLVELALSSPGIVLTRALRRHWIQKGTPVPLDIPVATVNRRSTTTPRQLLQALAVDGLRRYLDRPWFATALTRRSKQEFPEALQQAVIDGNLEAVLDEHFWFVSSTNSKSWSKRIAELQAALTLSGGRSLFHVTKTRTVRVRANLALPLHQAKDESPKSHKGKPSSQRVKDEARPDTVRHAFNTPFWPMVLATTSVGQEGLDFHAWCKTIVHWDPASGPVELEQREGRVNRYAGVAIRQAVWAQASQSASCEADATQPARGWRALSLYAEKELAPLDGSGLAPWWCLDGAHTFQLYPHAAGSRERPHREDLERRRAMYRMVLGASEPSWLLDELVATEPPLTPARIAQASLQLGAWELQPKYSTDS